MMTGAEGKTNTLQCMAWRLSDVLVRGREGKGELEGGGRGGLTYTLLCYLLLRCNNLLTKFRGFDMAKFRNHISPEWCISNMLYNRRIPFWFRGTC